MAKIKFFENLTLCHVDKKSRSQGLIVGNFRNLCEKISYACHRKTVVYLPKTTLKDVHLLHYFIMYAVKNNDVLEEHSWVVTELFVY